MDTLASYLTYDADVTINDTATGEIIREPAIDPHPGLPTQTKKNTPVRMTGVSTMTRLIREGCLDSSLACARGDLNPHALSDTGT